MRTNKTDCPTCGGSGQLPADKEKAKDVIRNLSDIFYNKKRIYRDWLKGDDKCPVCWGSGKVE